MEDLIDLVLDLLKVDSGVLELEVGKTKIVVLSCVSLVGSIKTGVVVLHGVEEVVSDVVELVESILFNGELILEGVEIALSGGNFSADSVSLVDELSSLILKSIDGAVDVVGISNAGSKLVLKVSKGVLSVGKISRGDTCLSGIALILLSINLVLEVSDLLRNGVLLSNEGTSCLLGA